MAFLVSSSSSIATISPEDFLSSSTTSLGEDDCIFEVQLHSCKNLPVSDFGLGNVLPTKSIPILGNLVEATMGNLGRVPNSDPYLKIKLRNRLTGIESSFVTSDKRYRTTDPSWLPAESFFFVLKKKDLANTRVLMSVFDYDSITSDDPLGDGVASLSDALLLSSEEENINTNTNTEVKSISMVDVKTGESIPDNASIQISLNTFNSFNGVSAHQVVYEYQRWTPTGGWGSYLLPTDPSGHWSNKSASTWGKTLKEIYDDVEVHKSNELRSFEFGVWSLPGDTSDADNAAGWKFGNDFRQSGWSRTASNLLFCRRRRWCRKFVVKEK
ncbi:hypothetical protein ScalyP_jg9406 [Parmales sp. scaly parma]|nr:hypothetical protein ScalyP_jg9406 [Parmales sp. scaly parma]